MQSLHNGVLSDEVWPPLFEKRHIKDSILDPLRLPALWRGEIKDEFAEATVVGTAAIALKLMGNAESIDEAQQMARKMWEERSKEKYSALK